MEKLDKYGNHRALNILPTKNKIRKLKRDWVEFWGKDKTKLITPIIEVEMQSKYIYIYIYGLSLIKCFSCISFLGYHELALGSLSQKWTKH